MATLTARKGVDVGTADPEEQALVRAICANPFDDLPRLRYADWLEERGQVERSEFIRNQIEWFSLMSYRLPHNGGTSTGPDMAKQKRERLAELQKRDRELMRCSFIQEQLPQGESWVIKWERGFVSRVECALREFMGGVCAICGGNGYYDQEDEREIQRGRYTESCHRCNSTGRTTGLVDTLFRVHPVEDVVISDLMPWNPEARSGHSWWTEYSVGEIFRDRVPHDLYELLDGYDYADSNYKRYPTRESAIAALSRVCVSLGRKRAGLPPI